MSVPMTFKYSIVRKLDVKILLVVRSISLPCTFSKSVSSEKCRSPSTVHCAHFHLFLGSLYPPNWAFCLAHLTFYVVLRGSSTLEIEIYWKKIPKSVGTNEPVVNDLERTFLSLRSLSGLPRSFVLVEGECPVPMCSHGENVCFVLLL